MNEEVLEPKTERTIWVRGLQMVLMALTYQLASTVLLAVAIFQFAWVLINNTANVHLVRLGRSLGRYQHQVARFVSFASENPPFPFADWPSGDEDQTFD